MPELVFGAGGIGSTGEGWFTNTWTDEASTNELLELLSSQNIRILDGASGYPPGNPGDTSRLLGLSQASSKGFLIDTKVSAIGRDSNGKPKPCLSPEMVDEIVTKDLALLGVDKVRCLYIHADGPSDPIPQQAHAMDQQVKKGRCEMIGLSNYSPTRLAEYLDFCDKNRLTKPKIYQCHYNALTRDIEKTGHELDLCRKHGVKIYAYSPLAGGYLSGKFLSAKDLSKEDQEKTLTGTRWKKDGVFQMYLSIFDKPGVHDAMRQFMKTCAAQDPPVDPAEVSLRWLAHHSALGSGDGIIIGASRSSQISRSVDAFEKGVLSEALRQAVERLWFDSDKDLAKRQDNVIMTS